MHLSYEAFKKAARRRSDRLSIPLNQALAELSSDFGFRNLHHAQTCLMGKGGPEETHTLLFGSSATEPDPLDPSAGLADGAAEHPHQGSTGLWALPASVITSTLEKLVRKRVGEDANWQKQGSVLWEAIITALCYWRDTRGFRLCADEVVRYLSLTRIEELYVEGFRESQAFDEWSYFFLGIKSYLETGCPGYRVDKLLARYGLGSSVQGDMLKPGATEQDANVFEQHTHRVMQIMPGLVLLQEIEEKSPLSPAIN